MGPENPSALTTLVSGLAFPEGLRWHDDRLWFSDIEARKVCSVDLMGNLQTELELDDHPSGLGWLPDGTLLVVSMRRQLILAVGGGRTKVHSDLSRSALGHLNDMIVDDCGRAYVGSMGYDVWAGERFKPGNICLVEATGSSRVAAENLAFPNGMAIDRNRTLIVAESVGQALTAFDIGLDGSLSCRRLWASTKGETPDGIALDQYGAIWIASAHSGQAIRYDERGAIRQRVHLPPNIMAFSLSIGGSRNDLLFIGCSSRFGTERENRLISTPGAIRYIPLILPPDLV